MSEWTEQNEHDSIIYSEGYNDGYADGLNENEVKRKILLELSDLMYKKSFLEDSDMQKWDSGCWIRYKLFENCIDELFNKYK